ncbi:hypothetical protein NDU88_002591 [Pleurodeles waltl]|uniref:Uncharacterized protein n=1 Tax=Pleurodeles waltl TaxID=8319 RepID=A0AAV7UBN2_PLEWA|nr:hypothetical protein NDU88_002591 [Pleurodeles waltl]
MRGLVRWQENPDSLSTGVGALFQGRVAPLRGPLEQPVQRFIRHAGRTRFGALTRKPRFSEHRSGGALSGSRQCAVPWSSRVQKLVRHAGELSPSPRGGALPGSRRE